MVNVQRLGGTSKNDNNMKLYYFPAHEAYRM